jgi:hexokinase
MERKARVRVLPTHSDGGPAKEGWMGINTEWSDFTTRKVKLLQEDRELDAASVNVGLQMFEKMMSGRNIGGGCCRRGCLI